MTINEKEVRICCEEMRKQRSYDYGIKYDGKVFYAEYDGGCSNLYDLKYCPWCAKTLEIIL
jgi:hypothetical protein